MEPNKQWTISEKIGKVSGIEQVSKHSKCIIILGHGAGAGMKHPFMSLLSDALVASNIGVVRYNFPYMEQGKRRPDYPAVAHKTIQTITENTKANHTLPIFLSGKSFGGRMASQWVSKSNTELVKGLIFYGFPLHGIGKDGKERAEHLYTIKQPMLFLQGTKDKLARKDLIEEVTQNINKSHLHFVDNADHSFKVPKKTGYSHEDVINQLASETNQWIDQLILK